MSARRKLVQFHKDDSAPHTIIDLLERNITCHACDSSLTLLFGCEHVVFAQALIILCFFLALLRGITATERKYHSRTTDARGPPLSLALSFSGTTHFRPPQREALQAEHPPKQGKDGTIHHASDKVWLEDCV